MDGYILALNAGSSSLRLGAYDCSGSIASGTSENLSPAPVPNPRVLTTYAQSRSLGRPRLVVHRVVHGGLELTEPKIVDGPVEEQIRRMEKFAPLHNSVALEWIAAAREAFDPETAHLACFDSALYKDMPTHASQYALPRVLCEKYGIRRYGFHGLAHQSMLRQWSAECGKRGQQRVITLQLGSGCSVTASVDLQPVETTMGFSPLEGLMMSTRSGNLDPSVVLHLIDHGFQVDELTRLFNGASGLLAVSEYSSHMQTLLEKGGERAELAVTMFCHSVKKAIGASMSVLGGADAVVFGGGIGENAPAIRQRVLGSFGWANVHLDIDKNVALDPAVGGTIHSEKSITGLWVIPTDECGEMALMAAAFLSEQASKPEQPSGGAS